MQGKRQSSHAKFLKTPTSLSLKGTGSEGARDIDPYFHQEEKTASGPALIANAGPLGTKRWPSRRDSKD